MHDIQSKFPDRLLVGWVRAVALEIRGQPPDAPLLTRGRDFDHLGKAGFGSRRLVTPEVALGALSPHNRPGTRDAETLSSCLMGLQFVFLGFLFTGHATILLKPGLRVARIKKAGCPSIRPFISDSQRNAILPDFFQGRAPIAPAYRAPAPSTWYVLPSPAFVRLPQCLQDPWRHLLEAGGRSQGK